MDCDGPNLDPEGHKKMLKKWFTVKDRYLRAIEEGRSVFEEFKLVDINPDLSKRQPEILKYENR